MRRSWTRWPRRLSDSKSSAHVAPRAIKTKAPPALTAVPDRKKCLSDGILVRGTILARVLGMRILTLDTTVMLAPAEITAESSAPTNPPTITSARSYGVSPRPRAAGHGLAEAIRNINDGAEILAKSRYNGS